jgi:hypothetical protein
MNVYTKNHLIISNVANFKTIEADAQRQHCIVLLLWSATVCVLENLAGCQHLSTLTVHEFIAFARGDADEGHLHQIKS